MKNLSGLLIVLTATCLVSPTAFAEFNPGANPHGNEPLILAKKNSRKVAAVKGIDGKFEIAMIGLPMQNAASSKSLTIVPIVLMSGQTLNLMFREDAKEALDIHDALRFKERMAMDDSPWQIEIKGEDFDSNKGTIRLPAENVELVDPSSSDTLALPAFVRRYNLTQNSYPYIDFVTNRMLILTKGN
jgi:hypothetical protein